MLETSQTIPELVAWTREREFALNLSTERLAFYWRLRFIIMNV